MRRLRVLLITKVFPNAMRPEDAPFNRHQFAALSRYCDVEVLATIPWFPGAARFSKWPIATGAPREEVIDGMPVRHPRFLYVPRVAQGLNGALYAGSLVPEVALRCHTPDVIVGAFAYPDGCAAVCLGRLLRIPTVIKVHGTDIDVLPNRHAVARSLSWGLQRAARIVAVSHTLADGVEALGVPRERIDVVMNGVHSHIFRPQDRVDARRRLGRAPERRTILFVGELVRDKGIFDLIEVFQGLASAHADLDLVLVGDGAEMQACRAAAGRLGGRLTVIGARPHHEIADWMAACDVLALPSRHEGTPNVVIEALASGRRVVATSVGGVPGLLHSAALGDLVPPKDQAALAAALARAAYEPYDAARVAALSGWRDWDHSARRLYEVLESVARPRREESTPARRESQDSASRSHVAGAAL
ncbi:glycosyltransferase family 4 protein [Sorangium sp. So ce341]|uniref:glycosyltransferase family 4 protein n=1 Tax=Sorangium sp. So ce341 TaxID=3133302 RepID=UPI003F611AD8